MGVGKSTAIMGLEQALGSVPRLVKFAQPLYNMQEFIYGQIASVYDRPADFTKDRKLLQWLGTDWGRGINENLWVDIWNAEAVRLMRLGYTVVCDDVRFDNEAELIRKLGGVVIKITSDKSDVHIDTGAGIANHASEAGIKPELINFTVDNSGTLVEYRRKLMRAYEQLGVKSIYDHN